MNKTRSFIRFALNGEIQEVSGADCFLMLADYLRKKRGLTGTKVVCAEGDCGACTVLKAFALKGQEPRFRTINACIALLAQLDGAHVVTVEGLADEGGALSPVQAALVQHHGSQCGYCTPGIVVSLSGLLNECHEVPSIRQVKNCLT